MILFNYENIDFRLDDESKISQCNIDIIEKENHTLKEINYIFCNDKYLNRINKKYLNHTDLTDIISFDYTENKKIFGDIFISIDRVKENAVIFKIPFEKELKRVIVHGILHYLGYKDKTEKEKKSMREKENEYI